MIYVYNIYSEKSGRKYGGLPSPFKRSLYVIIIKSKDIIFFELVCILYSVKFTLCLWFL